MGEIDINELIDELEVAAVRYNEIPGNRNQLVAARVALRAAIAAKDAEIARLKAIVMRRPPEPD